MKEHQLADKWIAEMEEAGLTPDEMTKVIQLARQKFNAITTCECGKQHSLVAEFGKCGACYNKIYGGNGDPTYG
jgi:hypothetical protein